MKKWELPIIILLLIVISAGIIINTNSNIPKYSNYVYIPPKPQKVDPLEVERLTNEYRVSKGLSPLVHDERLCTAAQTKLDDMVKRDYYAHNTPDGKLPWTFFTGSYYKLGENLSDANNTAVGTIKAWQVSPKHNDNLLESVYRQTCVKTHYRGFQSELVVAWYGNI